MMPACLDAQDEIIPCWAFHLFLTSGSLYICYISLRYGLYPFLKSYRKTLCKAKCRFRTKSFANSPKGAAFRNAVDFAAQKVVIHDSNKGYGYREYIEEPPVLAGSYKFKCSIGRTVISRSGGNDVDDIEEVGYTNMTTTERKCPTRNVLNLNIKESSEHLGWSLSGSRVGTMSPQQHATGAGTGTGTGTVTKGTWILEGHINEEGDAYWIESQQLRSNKEVAKEVLVYGKFTTPTQFHGEWLSSTDGRRGNYTDFVSLPLTSTSNEEQMDITSTEVCVVGVPIQTC